MGFQRPGRYQRPLVDMERIPALSLTKFFKEAKEIYKVKGDSDAALIFEMMENYMRNSWHGGPIETKKALPL